MSILDKVSASIKKNLIGRLTNAEVSIEARKRFGNPFSQRITPSAVNMRQEDLASWKRAGMAARNPENPNRIPMLDVYDNIRIDNHLTSIIESRVQRVLRTKWIVVDEGSGEEVPDKSDLLERKWFEVLVREAMYAVFMGPTFVEITDVEDEIKKVTAIPRRHVRPEKGDIILKMGDSKGEIVTEGPYSDFYIMVGKEPTDLGLLYQAAPMALGKKYAIGAWNEFVEIYGIPPRWAKTPIRDTKRQSQLASVLQNMGSAGWGIFDENEKIEIGQLHSGDPYRVFEKLISLCNDEMSKLILGQTLTTDVGDNGGTYAQAKVHAEVASDRHEADIYYIEYLLNDELLPRLITLGYPLQNCRIKRDDSQEMETGELIKAVTSLSQFYLIDPEYITEKTGIPVEPKMLSLPPAPGGPTDGKKPVNP